jgi:hypothetical protein
VVVLGACAAAVAASFLFLLSPFLVDAAVADDDGAAVADDDADRCAAFLRFVFPLYYLVDLLQ